MKLSSDEVAFLRHWIFDEARFLKGQGAAKRLQLAHRATPADLATLIAAGMPDTTDQECAAQGPPPASVPSWPWSPEALSARLAQARAVLAQRQEGARRTSGTESNTSLGP